MSQSQESFDQSKIQEQGIRKTHDELRRKRRRLNDREMDGDDLDAETGGGE